MLLMSITMTNNVYKKQGELKTMKIKELKKYLDLPYLLIILGIIGIIRALYLFNYSNFYANSFNNFFSPIILILTMVFVLKVLRKKQYK